MIKRFNHVGIAVKNLDRAVEFVGQTDARRIALVLAVGGLAAQRRDHAIAKRRQVGQRRVLIGGALGIALDRQIERLKR